MATYYVDSVTGNDGDDGLSLANAWATLSKVNGYTFAANDTIILVDDSVWRETLTLPRNDLIVDRSYTGTNAPRILGSAALTGWTEDTGHWVCSYSSNPTLVWFKNSSDGKIHWGSKKASKAACTAEYDWYQSGSSLWCYAATDPDTRYTAVEAQVRDACIAGNGKTYITIRGLELAYSYKFGVQLYSTACTNWLINGNEIHHIGVPDASEAEGVLVRGANHVISNNTIYQCGNHGIYTMAMSGVTPTHDVIVEGNRVYDCYHTCIDTAALDPGVVYNVTLRYNNCYTTSEFAFPSTMTCNLMYLSGWAVNKLYNVSIYYNTLHHTMTECLQLDRYTNLVNIYNNVVYGANPLYTNPSVLGIGIGVNTTDIVLKNNIGFDFPTRAVFMYNGAGVTVCDYNIWFNSVSVNQYVAYGGVDYGVGDFAAYKAASGFDTHGFWENPDLTDPANNDFTPTSVSPGIDTGVDLSFTRDIVGETVPIGSAPDIGAYEYAPGGGGRRVSTVGVMVEQMPDTNNRRVSTVGLMVEQMPDINNRRVSAVGLMVEQKAFPDNRRVSAVGLMIEWKGAVTITDAGNIASEEAWGIATIGVPVAAETRITQLDAEALVDTPNTVIVSQSDAEALVDTPNTVIVSQSDVETLVDTPNTVRISQLSIEILKENVPPPTLPIPPDFHGRDEDTRTTICGFFRQRGVSVQVYEPIVKGMAYIGELTDKLQSYQHSKNAIGGYLSMQITIVGTMTELEEWFENGIGRHIVTYNPAGIPVMEAFVNQITFNVGGISEQRGPLMGIANTVRAIYSPKDSSVYPPTVGAQTTTVLVQDLVSVAKYGAVEKAINAGSCTLAEAEQARDTYLSEYRYPESVGGLNLSSMNMPNIVLDCLGYVKWTDVYVYGDNTVGYSAISDKIKAILAAEYNSIFSTDYSYITTNLFLTGTSELGDKYASTIIKSLLAIGDANDNRYLFGCYRDRVFKYNRIPTTAKYVHHLSDPRQRIFEHDNPVDPWDLQAGNWVFIPDFLTGRYIQGTPLRKDPRNKFIESVTYTAPSSIDLSGGKTDPLSQFLAKLGVGQT